jgi:hypothetical protein
MKDFILLEALVNGLVTIEFTKKDGTNRVMKCTLNSDTIPVELHPKNEGVTSKSEEAQRVFDVEKNEWRSFRWDSLNNYYI